MAYTLGYTLATCMHVHMLHEMASIIMSLSPQAPALLPLEMNAVRVM